MGKKKRKKTATANPRDPHYVYTLKTDGACVGNPGPMGIGGALRNNSTGEAVATFSESAGRGTNNEAEYLAVIRGLELAKEHGVDSLLVQSDSQLVVYQIIGAYAIKKAHLFALKIRVDQAVKRLGCPIRFDWIPREQNSEADALASQAVGTPMAKVSEEGKVQYWQWDLDFVVNQDELAKLPALNDVCRKGINHIHQLKEKARFADFADLKTGGIDAYSRMGRTELQHAVEVRFGSSTWQWLMDTFGVEPSEYAHRVLRWVARGLRPDLAAKKVSVDQEITANARAKQAR